MIVHIQNWATSCCSQWPKITLIGSFLKISESGNKLTQRKKNAKNYAFLFISSEFHSAAACPESFSFPQTLFKNFILSELLPSHLSSSPLPVITGPISRFLHLHYPDITLMSAKSHSDKLTSLKVKKGKGHSTPASVRLPLSHDHIEQQFPSPFTDIEVRSEVPQIYNKGQKATYHSTLSICSIR